MSKTWLIFENGSYYSLDCSLHKAPKGHPKPVDTYIVTEHEGDFTIAARKAVHAVYNAAVNRGIDIEPVVAGFDLSERTSLDSGLVGQSGSLSFAVSFAQKLFSQDPGNVAATGVVEAGGRIGPVKGIETKIRTAAGLVKDGGIILFPSLNLNDLPEGLINKLKQQNIRYLPVDDLNDVFESLFQFGPVEKQADVEKVKRYLLLLLIFSAAVFGVWYLNQSRDQTLSDKASGVTSEHVTPPDSPEPVLSTQTPLRKIQEKITPPVPEKTGEKETSGLPVPVKEKERVQVPTTQPVMPEKDKEDQGNFKKDEDKGFD